MFCTVPIAIKKPEQGISFSVVLWASYSQNLSATIATNVLRKDLFQRANSFSMSIYLHFRSGRRLNSKRRITAEQLGFRLQGGILAFLSKQIIFVLTCETLVGFESPERKKKGANEGMNIEECTSLSVLISPHLLMQQPKIVII